MKNLSTSAISIIIACIVFLYIFFGFIEFAGIDWNNIVIAPLIIVLMFLCRALIDDIISNHVKNLPRITDLKYSLFVLLKKHDYELDDIEAYITHTNDYDDAQRIMHILKKNKIQIDSVEKTQEIIEHGDIVDIISTISDKQTRKELSGILKDYGKDEWFRIIRSQYETKELLNRKKAFNGTFNILSIASIVLGIYVIQDIWYFVCTHWINLIILCVLMIIQTVITYSKTKNLSLQHYTEVYNEINKAINHMKN